MNVSPFFVKGGGELQGISVCQNRRSDIVIPAGWPSGVCLKGEGKKKTVQAIESYLLANTSLCSHLHHYSNMFYFQHCCSR